MSRTDQISSGIQSSPWFSDSLGSEGSGSLSGRSVNKASGSDSPLSFSKLHAQLPSSGEYPPSDEYSEESGLCTQENDISPLSHEDDSTEFSSKSSFSEYSAGEEMMVDSSFSSSPSSFAPLANSSSSQSGQDTSFESSSSLPKPLLANRSLEVFKKTELPALRTASPAQSTPEKEKVAEQAKKALVDVAKPAPNAEQTRKKLEEIQAQKLFTEQWISLKSNYELSTTLLGASRIAMLISGLALVFLQNGSDNHKLAETIFWTSGIGAFCTGLVSCALKDQIEEIERSAYPRFYPSTI